MANKLRTAVAAALLLASAAAAPPQTMQHPLYLGADLSFSNEMDDCGARFLDANGKPADPFALLKANGGNLVRVRLWNDPSWTRYSTLADVEKTIRRAKAAGLQVLLDFHYSDDWADGDKQRPPKAWAALDTDGQAKALHDYTYAVLTRLAGEELMPELVQVGNEINQELLGGTKGHPIDWTRNAKLINAGVAAVREAGRATNTRPRVMLHIAQPENVEPWFDAATVAGVRDYDIIGMSYYRKWSTQSVAQLGATIARVHARYAADVVVVETAYPFTEESGDSSPNLLGVDTLDRGYPATPDGQLRYMTDLTRTVVANRGSGVVYWAPDWVSTKCKTRWGNGSSWENAAWFDIDRHVALPVWRFLSVDYRSARQTR